MEFQNNLLDLGIEQHYHYVNEKAKKFRVGKKTNQIVKKMREEDKQQREIATALSNEISEQGSPSAMDDIHQETSPNQSKSVLFTNTQVIRSSKLISRMA